MDDNIFYSALKNAQPLAFLGSLCIIIAVFTHESETISNVYPNAISASMSFIAAFITSLVSQIFSNIKKLEILEIRIRFATWFFVFMGILHILAIIISFGKTTSEIYDTLSGWLYGLIIIFSLYYIWIYYEKKKNKEKFLLQDKSRLLSIVIFFVGSFFILSIHLIKLFFNIEILDDIASSSIFIFSALPFSIVIIFGTKINNLTKNFQDVKKIMFVKLYRIRYYKRRKKNNV